MDPIVELIAECGGIPGKKVFQKLCYFLQEQEGVRLGARFRMRHYGPYSDELDDRLEDLAEQRIVRIDGSSEDGFRISLGDVAEVEEVSPQVTSLLSILGSDLHKGLTLELLATAHFLATTFDYEGTEEDKDLLADKVRAWKGSKFDRPFIRANIDRLEEIGYLPAAA